MSEASMSNLETVIALLHCHLETHILLNVAEWGNLHWNVIANSIALH